MLVHDYTYGDLLQLLFWLWVTYQLTAFLFTLWMGLLVQVIGDHAIADAVHWIVQRMMATIHALIELTASWRMGS